MIVGIDPGAHGAIAWLDEMGGLITVEDMPSVQIKVGTKMRTRVSAPMLVSLFKDWPATTHAFIEKVGAMPGQGTASMFSFGFSAGLIEGALAGLGIGCTMVTPQSWKKAMQLRDDKGGARLRAAQLWPHKAPFFARVKDDGRAEAAMIGLYGAQMRQGFGKAA